VSVALWLAVTVPDVRPRGRGVQDGGAARLGGRGGVEYAGPARDPGARSVTGRARYVSEGRQRLVIDEEFSQQLHLMRQVKRRCRRDIPKQRRFSVVDERVLKLNIAIFHGVGSAPGQRRQQ